MAEKRLTLLACGDVGPIHAPVGQYGQFVKETIGKADVRFAQVERVYSERGSLQLHSGGGHSRLKPHMADVFKKCGFNVLSLASNHAMDWGADALLDSIDLFKGQGIQVIGAGPNLQEARKPAIVESNGVRVALLAYCSVLNEGYAAEPDKPGVAPLRAHTYFRPTDYQPGVPPQVITVPYPEDLQAMVDDIVMARQISDSVVLSMHWGIHFVPKVIADYQITVAKAAFSAGADMIVGHHAHIPKAIACEGQKVCFYSLSNFIMGSRSRSEKSAREFEKKYGVKLDPDYPNLAYGADAKRSLIAKADISRRGVDGVSFLPVIIDKELRPEILRSSDPRFGDMLAYMEDVSEGFPHKFVVDGDEIRVIGT